MIGVGVGGREKDRACAREPHTHTHRERERERERESLWEDFFFVAVVPHEIQANLHISRTRYSSYDRTQTAQTLMYVCACVTCVRAWVCVCVWVGGCVRARACVCAEN